MTAKLISSFNYVVRGCERTKKSLPNNNSDIFLENTPESFGFNEEVRATLVSLGDLVSNSGASGESSGYEVTSVEVVKIPGVVLSVLSYDDSTKSFVIGVGPRVEKGSRLSGFHLEEGKFRWNSGDSSWSIVKKEFEGEASVGALLTNAQLISLPTGPQEIVGNANDLPALSIPASDLNSIIFPVELSLGVKLDDQLSIWSETEVSLKKPNPGQPIPLPNPPMILVNGANSSFNLELKDGETAVEYLYSYSEIADPRSEAKPDKDLELSLASLPAFVYPSQSLSNITLTKSEGNPFVSKVEGPVIPGTLTVNGGDGNTYSGVEVVQSNDAVFQYKRCVETIGPDSVFQDISKELTIKGRITIGGTEFPLSDYLKVGPKGEPSLVSDLPDGNYVFSYYVKGAPVSDEIFNLRKDAETLTDFGGMSPSNTPTERQVKFIELSASPILPNSESVKIRNKKAERGKDYILNPISGVIKLLKRYSASSEDDVGVSVSYTPLYKVEGQLQVLNGVIDTILVARDRVSTVNMDIDPLIEKIIDVKIFNKSCWGKQIKIISDSKEEDVTVSEDGIVRYSEEEFNRSKNILSYKYKGLLPYGSPEEIGQFSIPGSNLITIDGVDASGNPSDSGPGEDNILEGSIIRVESPGKWVHYTEVSKVTKMVTKSRTFTEVRISAPLPTTTRDPIVISRTKQACEFFAPNDAQVKRDKAGKLYINLSSNPSDKVLEETLSAYRPGIVVKIVKGSSTVSSIVKSSTIIKETVGSVDSFYVVVEFNSKILESSWSDLKLEENPSVKIYRSVSSTLDLGSTSLFLKRPAILSNPIPWFSVKNTGELGLFKYSGGVLPSSLEASLLGVEGTLANSIEISSLRTVKSFEKILKNEDSSTVLAVLAKVYGVTEDDSIVEIPSAFKVDGSNEVILKQSVGSYLNDFKHLKVVYAGYSFLGSTGSSGITVSYARYKELNKPVIKVYGNSPDQYFISYAIKSEFESSVGTWIEQAEKKKIVQDPSESADLFRSDLFRARNLSIFSEFSSFETDVASERIKGWSLLYEELKGQAQFYLGTEAHDFTSGQTLLSEAKLAGSTERLDPRLSGGSYIFKNVAISPVFSFSGTSVSLKYLLHLPGLNANLLNPYIGIGTKVVVQGNSFTVTDVGNHYLLVSSKTPSINVDPRLKSYSQGVVPTDYVRIVSSKFPSLRKAVIGLRAAKELTPIPATGLGDSPIPSGVITYKGTRYDVFHARSKKASFSVQVLPEVEGNPNYGKFLNPLPVIRVTRSSEPIESFASFDESFVLRVGSSTASFDKDSELPVFLTLLNNLSSSATVVPVFYKVSENLGSAVAEISIDGDISDTSSTSDRILGYEIRAIAPGVSITFSSDIEEEPIVIKPPISVDSGLRSAIQDEWKGSLHNIDEMISKSEKALQLVKDVLSDSDSLLNAVTIKTPLVNWGDYSTLVGKLGFKTKSVRFGSEGAKQLEGWVQGQIELLKDLAETSRSPFYKHSFGELIAAPEDTSSVYQEITTEKEVFFKDYSIPGLQLANPYLGITLELSGDYTTIQSINKDEIVVSKETLSGPETKVAALPKDFLRGPNSIDGGIVLTLSGGDSRVLSVPTECVKSGTTISFEIIQNSVYTGGFLKFVRTNFMTISSSNTAVEITITPESANSIKISTPGFEEVASLPVVDLDVAGTQGSTVLNIPYSGDIPSRYFEVAIPVTGTKVYFNPNDWEKDLGIIPEGTSESLLTTKPDKTVKLIDSSLGRPGRLFLSPGEDTYRSSSIITLDHSAFSKDVFALTSNKDGKLESRLSWGSEDGKISSQTETNEISVLDQWAQDCETLMISESTLQLLKLYQSRMLKPISAASLLAGMASRRS